MKQLLIQITSKVPERFVTRFHSGPVPSVFQNGAQWPQLFEKAFAAIWPLESKSEIRGYRALDGGTPEGAAKALELLVCQETQVWYPNPTTTPQDLGNALDSAIAKGPASIHINRYWRKQNGLPTLDNDSFSKMRGRNLTPGGAHNLHDGHAYQLVGKDTAGKYLLGNPLNGGEPPLRLTTEELSGCLRGVVGLK